MYDNIKSKFIKNKFKGLKWNEKNKEYIDNLVFIERYVLGKVKGWTTGYSIIRIKEKYQKDFEAIYKELKPKQFKRMKEQEKIIKRKEKKAMEEASQKRRDDAWKDIDVWAKMGGKF